jgi:hypothetical protein
MATDVLMGTCKPKADTTPSQPAAASPKSTGAKPPFVPAPSASRDEGRGREGTVVREEDIARTKVDIDSGYDRFSGYTVVKPSKPKTLAGGGILGTSDVSLIPGRFIPKNGEPFYYIRIVYSGYGWAFLNGRVQFLVDGTEHIEVKGAGSDGEREVGSCSSALGCHIAEGMDVPVEPSVFARLARAHSVEVRVVGDRGSLERWFKKEHFAQIRILLDRYGS